MPKIIHVLGSGNPLDPTNFTQHARLDAAVALHQPGDVIVLHGGNPIDGLTEAERGSIYLGPSIDEKLSILVHLMKSCKSTSESLQKISTTLPLTYKIFPEEEWINTEHIIITNWPYVWRTRFLLRIIRSHFGSSLVKGPIKVIGVNGVFKPYAAKFGLLYAIKRLLFNVLLREAGAWLKAILDPFDRRLNQQRQSQRWFG